MKRVISIFIRDFKSSIREFLLLYMMVGPLLLTFGFSLFIPSSEAASLQFAMVEGIDQNVISHFEKYGSVDLFSDIDALNNRVLDIDDVAGIVEDEGGALAVILEGNEGHDTETVPLKIIQDFQGNYNTPIAYETSSVGETKSPLLIIGGAALMMTVIILGGIVVGFNIIEEKEAKTIGALNVTQMSKFEFVIGKSIIGFILPVVQIYLMTYILKISDINFTMALLVIVTGSFTSAVTGFLIGAISENQIAGVLNMKIIYLVAAGSILGAMLLPDTLQKFLYVIPTYWIFTGFRDIITLSMTWQGAYATSAWITGTTMIILLVVRKRIQKGLA